MRASSNLMDNSSLSPPATSNTIVTDSNNSDLTNNSNTSRYKNYLIEKLLNESIAPLQNSLKLTNDIMFQTNNNNCNNIKIGNGLNDSREDLTSETGTYVIDEQVSGIRHCNSNNSNNFKQSENAIDLISARAAIDETFGVVISGSMEDPAVNLINESTTPQLTPKRQTQKIIRARNQTYSLTKDLLMNSGTDMNLSTNSIPYNDCETRLLSNDSSFNSSLLRKTATYDIIPNGTEKTEFQSPEIATSEANGIEGSSELAKDDDYENNNKSINESTVSTIKTIGTDVLIGDTERLMEHLKLKRFEKRQSLKARLISANHNLNQSRSSSSSCSSSTTVLSGNQNRKELDDNKNNKYLANNNTNGRTAKSWIIPLQTYYNEEEETTKSLNEMYLNSTRATVNGSQDLSNSTITTKIQQIKNQSKTNGGMAFDFILDNNNSPVIYRNKPTPLSSSNINSHNNSHTYYDNDESLASNTSNSISASSGFNHLRRLKSSADSTTTGSAITSITTPKSGLSLGAKIQTKAKENLFNTNNNNNTRDLAAKQRQSLRRSSDNSSLLITNTNNSNSTSQNPSQYTNRTLMLRQQTAKARRNSDNKLTSDQDLSPPNSIIQSNMKQKPTLNGVLKKSDTNGSNGNSYTNGATSSMVSIKSTVSRNVTNLTYKSFSNLTTSVSSPTSKSKKSSRSNSRETTNQNGNGLMTTSLTLPNGSNSLTGGSSHTDQRDSFLRRKTYDPVRAVELEKKKKEELKRKSLLLEQEQQQLKITEDFDVKSQNSNSNGANNCLNCLIDENSVCDSFSSFPLPNTIANRQPKSKPLTNSVSFDQQSSKTDNHRSEDETSTYEKILQSTLQRLCIRLIQMSTGVLDKIGDNSSKNIEPSSLLNTAGSTELERMQQLAKLVHSMQLVHDHVQIIDSTLFNPKPEEAYMKELSRIRQELASLNASSNLIYNFSQNNPQ